MLCFIILLQLPVCYDTRGEVCENNIYVLQVCNNAFYNNVLVAGDKRQVCNMICAGRDSNVSNVSGRGRNHARALSAWGKPDIMQRKKQSRKAPLFSLKLS